MSMSRVSLWTIGSRSLIAAAARRASTPATVASRWVGE
jgi:hypothetical protein